MKKSKTIAYGNVKEYATVPARIKEFREECPNGVIETFPTVTEDSIIFKAVVKKEASGAESTGHSFKRFTGEPGAKLFEKQETIAVGRALALLGYASDGDIASSEEMEDFLEQKQAALADEIMEATEAIGNCDTIEKLKECWASLSGEMKNNTMSIKEVKKAELLAIEKKNE